MFHTLCDLFLQTSRGQRFLISESSDSMFCWEGLALIVLGVRGMRYGDLTCCGSDTSAKQWSIVYLYSAGDGCPLLLLIAGLPKHRSLPSWISL
ncbi:uncharacterized protein LOC131241326 isoform X2 [Magnolia sinica]|uniref:uncharacterized protein LOC131241326 isoform X2 n=1 Tax=Magnolia sinica TaxID=86752 RepID=UPI00265B56A1|nr:uncharacterized protein LOC131241326 isoform X2 [Magnolia sinica]